MEWAVFPPYERILMKEIMHEKCKELFRESDVTKDVIECGMEQRVHEAR